MKLWKGVLKKLEKRYKRKNISYSEIKKHILNSYNQESMSLNLYNATELNFVFLPMKFNGMVIYGAKSKIYINLLSMFVDKKFNNEMPYFYGYTTLIHELEHIKIANIYSKNVKLSFLELLAVMEYIIVTKEGKIVLLIDKLATHNVYTKRYYTSPMEVLCIKAGYRKATEKFENIISKENIDKMKTICKALEIWEKQMEIGYLEKDKPYNLFVYLFVRLGQIIKKNKMIYNMYPILKTLYSANGDIRSLEEIYLELKEIDESLCDEVVLHIFMYYQKDYTDLFVKMPDLKKYIAELSNRYCEAASEFCDKIELMELFLDREIIMDNFTVIQNNVRQINNLMLYYEMEHTNGGIIPLDIC